MTHSGCCSDCPPASCGSVHSGSACTFRLPQRQRTSDESKLKALTETPNIEGGISTNSVANELATLTQLVHTNHAASMAAISEQRAHVAVNTPLPPVPSFVSPSPGQHHPPPRMQYVSRAQQQQQARPQEWAARERQQHQSPAQHGPQQHFFNGTGWQSECHTQ